MDATNSQLQEPNQGGSQHDHRWQEQTTRSNWPVYLLTIALLAAVTAGYVYVSHQRQQTRDLAAANHSLTTSLIQVQDQLQSVNQRLSDLLSRTTPPRVPSRARGTARVRQPGEARTVRDDPRFGNIQNQLSEHQKQIASARDDIDKTRSDLSQTRDDLQTNINSTKDELNGSVARTHDDVVALQQRGERNYYEFAVDKSKQYSRVGPLSVSLRKADTKHKRFDMMMLVDDNQLQKKSVNLYETVWLNLSDRPQPVELVVNKIAKDHIEGYLSEPKYKKSELDASASARPDSAKLR
jgi:hypothetical protein